MTLVELAVGIAVLSVICLVTARLFKAGIQSYNYTLSQVAALSNARKAIDGDGAAHGMVWAAREAASLSDLSADALTLKTSEGPALAFSVSGQVLRQTRLLDSRDQAKGVAGLQLTYYNLDDQGRIVESTEAASAVLVTSALTLRGPRDKTYRFFSGARLRNHW